METKSQLAGLGLSQLQPISNVLSRSLEHSDSGLAIDF